MRLNVFDNVGRVIQENEISFYANTIINYL